MRQLFMLKKLFNCKAWPYWSWIAAYVNHPTHWGDSTIHAISIAVGKGEEAGEQGGGIVPFLTLHFGSLAQSTTIFAHRRTRRSILTLN